jgi:hypothetical protein
MNIRRDNLFRLILSVFLATILFSCGTKEDTTYIKDESGATDAASLSIRKQCFNIVDGVETVGYPSTVLLFQTIGDNFLSRCTGTIVGANTVVTAAHCVANSESGNMAILQEDCTNGSFEFVDSTRVFHHGFTSDDFYEAQMYGAITPELIARDLAILLFPIEGANSAAPLYSATPAVDDDIEIVGFGIEYAPYDSRSKNEINFEDIKKRLGRNSLINYDDLMETIPEDQNPLGEGASQGEPSVFLSTLYELEKGEELADGTYSTTAQGDSGGPLYIGGMIAGVTSSGASLGDSSGKPIMDIGIFTNLQSPLSRDLLESAREDGAIFSGWLDYWDKTSDIQDY